jgi:DNA-binding MarR family transcriptional regulator
VPEPRFDELVHAPLRLRLCALLSTVEQVSFAYARDGLGVSDSVLSKHAAALQQAGYLAVDKQPRSEGTTTHLRLTAAGLRAYRGHIAALRAIVAGDD